MAIKDGSSPGELYERILIYADPKSGKTRLATSLTPRFGEAVYVAWDPGTERLGPVLEPYRSRLHVVQSVPTPKEKYAPDEDAFVLALTDWKARWPQVKTLIWDHMAATAEDVLAFVADSGQFSKAHISIGAPASAGKLNLPMEGDYGAVHGTIDRLTTYLFRQPLHLIVLCHSQMLEARDGSGLIGGPATIGKASVRKYAGRFDTVIRLGRKLKDGKEQFTAFTAPHSFWIAGIRSHQLSNPLPELALSPDPVNFWEQYDRFFAPAASPLQTV